MYKQYKQGASKLPALKLTYFNLTGRGETIRFVLNTAGITFEDVRIDFDQWGELKPKTPFKSLPMLEVDGTVIGQSATIARFVADLAGLAGTSAHERALVDSVSDCVTDIREGVFNAVYAAEEEKESRMAKQKEAVPNLLDAIAAFKAAHGGKFIVGDQVTLADLHFAATIEAISAAVPCDLESKGLKQVYDDVMALPNLAKYIKTRDAK